MPIPSAAHTATSLPMSSDSTQLSFGLYRVNLAATERMCLFRFFYFFSFEATEIHVNMRQYFFLIMKRTTSSPYIHREDNPSFFYIIGVICNEFFCLTKRGSLLEGAVLFHNLPVDEHPSKGRDQSMVFF